MIGDLGVYGLRAWASGHRGLGSRHLGAYGFRASRSGFWACGPRGFGGLRLEV